MKNTLKSLLVLAMVTPIAFFFACSSGEDVLPIDSTPPVLTLTAKVGSSKVALVSGGSVAATDSIVITASVAAENGFNTFRVIEGATHEVTRDDLSLDAGTQTATIPNFKIYTSATDANTTVTYKFIAVDENNLVDTVELMVMVEDVPSPTAKRIAATMLVVPLSASTSTNTFFAIGEALLYSRDDVENTGDIVSPNVDLGYYYGSTDKATLSAPSEYPSSFQDLSSWSTRNDTELELTTLTTTDYDGLTTIAMVDKAMADITFDAVNTVKDLQEGDIVAFKTVDGIDGFIVVKKINGTFNTDDNIELEFVLNQE